MWIISICISKPRQGIHSTHSCTSDIASCKRHYCFGNFTNRYILFTICVCCIHPSISIYFNKKALYLQQWTDGFTLCYTHTRLMGLFPGLPGWAGTRKVKPIWTLLKQETVSVSGISWAICKSSSHFRQITMPAPHHSVFTDRMPFLPPNQQCQSIQDNIYTLLINHK